MSRQTRTHSRRRGLALALALAVAALEAEIANAGDFCELVSHALADDVFHSPVLVTPGVLWHYTAATLSCRLRYRNTSHRITIRNSHAACRWLAQVAVGWRPDSLRFPSAASVTHRAGDVVAEDEGNAR
jgi:hypothetical protein